MKELDFTLTGIRPLLMHNNRLVDPLDEHTQRVAQLVKVSKSKKTEEAYRDLADAEFVGGLYFGGSSNGNGGIGPYVKAEAVEACLKKAAGTGFPGLGAKVARGAFVTSIDGADEIPLLYNGPRDVESLLADPNYRLRKAVKLGVMRVRPRFADWTLECSVKLDESQVDLRQLEAVAEYAGAYIGLGDHRPRFGRFEVALS